MSAYHPDHPPAPIVWLSRSAAERRDDIARSHQLQGWFDRGILHLHALEHDIVETGLALDRPAGLRELVDGLCALGFDRHDALHEIGYDIADALRAHHRGRPVDFGAALADAVDRQRATLAAIGATSPEKVIDWLAETEWDGPDTFAQQLISYRMDALAPAFVAVLHDPALRDHRHANAWAVPWAAEALSLARHPQGPAPTLDLVITLHENDAAQLQLRAALPRYGDLAVGPLLARLPELAPDEGAQMLWELVAHGARDPRLGPALEAATPHAPELVAEALAGLETPGYVAPPVVFRAHPVDPADLPEGFAIGLAKCGARRPSAARKRTRKRTRKQRRKQRRRAS